MTKIKSWIIGNKFLVAIIIAYLLLTLYRPALSVQGISNSSYYIKEMLMIMPVIFVLTALLDSWVPKATIMKLLGKEAKFKGVLFAFLLGSISAGPIYAAFPLCGMLYKKGASIKNIVIILSSWAVVKIPMLLNEAKFLGMKFMLVRWLLTVIAILIFAWFTELIVKAKDVPTEEVLLPKGVHINQTACMGCTICTQKYPAVFKMDNKKATVHNVKAMDQIQLQSAIKACPVQAITFQ